MLNFAPTEEQEEVRNLVRSLASDELRPQGRDCERTGDITARLMQTIAQTGITTPFPEELGGSGAIEAMTYTLIAEELGFGDGGLAMNILGSLMGPVAVLLAGDEQQQRAYIEPFCDAQHGYRQRGSFAYAERTGGYRVEDISTTVRLEGNRYIVNGTKRDVIHGGLAHPRVILARLEGTTDVNGLALLVVPADMDGIRIRNDVQKLGLLAAPGASYNFNRAAVEESYMLGQPGQSGVLRAAALYSILRAAVACGTARAALEYARDYAKERVAFGRPIASYQGIAFMVAEMAMHLDAARLYVWRAATRWDGGMEGEPLIRQAEAAQTQAMKMAKKATLDAIQILGGAGFLQDHPVEMWARNAAAME